MAESEIRRLSLKGKWFFVVVVVVFKKGRGERKKRSCFPGGSDGKVSTYNAGDPGSVPGSGRSPGEGNGNPLHYSCLENPMD